ncbi:MAG TPA: hypothetical protein VMV92_39035 [Streptosporangiaceae bacterium]|nr:hypothetical protein [Streptosporangiaceae bacterium]
MDNMYQPPGGDPQDSRSTEQFWPLRNGPAARRGHDAPGPGFQHRESPDVRQHFAADRHRALHWTIGLTVAVLLAVGGVLAGLSLADHAPSAGGAAPAAGTSSAGSPGAQAAALSTTLASADSPGTLILTSSASATGGASGSAAGVAAGTTVAHPCAAALRAARAARIAGRPRAAQAARVAAGRCRGLRLRLIRVSLLRGIDGQFAFRTADGVRTLAFERGVIQSVSGSDIVVRATDGTTWTWDLVSSTVVREHGAKTQRSALSAGQPVWVGGPVVSGAKDARLIVIRPPAGAAASSSPSASPAPSAPGS